MRKTNLVVALVMCTAPHGCGHQGIQLTSAQQSGLADQKSFYNSSTGTRPTAPDSARGVAGERCVDYAVETEVSEKCVAAWRVAIAGDTDKAMKQLEALDQKYPSMKTVALMKSQVMHHAGNDAKAIEYQKQAQFGDEFDALQIFKLAELERKAGKNEEAIASYHKLLDGSPSFAPGKLGLAKACLKVDPQSEEARKTLQALVDSKSDGMDNTNKEATELLASMKAGKK